MNVSLTRVFDQTMRIRTHFEFDCPACGTRLTLRADRREQSLRCQACGVELPGPDVQYLVLNCGSA